jgi:hypothetical protein
MPFSPSVVCYRRDGKGVENHFYRSGVRLNGYPGLTGIGLHPIHMNENVLMVGLAPMRGQVDEDSVSADAFLVPIHQAVHRDPYRAVRTDKPGPGLCDPLTSWRALPQ